MMCCYLQGALGTQRYLVLHPSPLEASKASWREKGPEPLIVNSGKASNLHSNEGITSWAPELHIHLHPEYSQLGDPTPLTFNITKLTICDQQTLRQSQWYHLLYSYPFVSPFPWEWAAPNNVSLTNKTGQKLWDIISNMEKAMAPHSSTLAWKIPCVEEPARLQSMGWLRVGHEWETSLSLFTFTNWRRKWQPTPVFLPGESQGRGSLVGCRLWGRTESDTTEVT